MKPSADHSLAQAVSNCSDWPPVCTRLLRRGDSTCENPGSPPKPHRAESASELWTGHRWEGQAAPSWLPDAPSFCWVQRAVAWYHRGDCKVPLLRVRWEMGRRVCRPPGPPARGFVSCSHQPCPLHPPPGSSSLCAAPELVGRAPGCALCFYLWDQNNHR